MRLALASAISLLALVGCGMSEEDKKSYSDEIQSAGKSADNYSKFTKEFLALDAESQRLGMGVDPDGLTKKNMDKALAYLKYGRCLRSYEKSGEKFVTAKTACTTESGLNN